MLRTRFCELVGVDHPVVLGGMGSGTAPALVAAVSGAGGLGILGATRLGPDAIGRAAAAIRAATDRPFGLNYLLFTVDEAGFQACLDARPAVISTAWAWPEQDLRAYFARAHGVGARVVHMVSTVAEAQRAAEAGADVVVAQGNEGGGHIGLMGTLPLVRMVVRAVAPIPVLAAGGVADGAGLAAALALGAEGVLLGTRFLATEESPLPRSYKEAIVASDGHDTIATTLPDVAAGQVWPGALVRVQLNRWMERWAAREPELRLRQADVAAALRQAREAGDVDGGVLLFGQTAGLIDSIVPAAEVVWQMVAEAEAIIRGRLGALVSG